MARFKREITDSSVNVINVFTEEISGGFWDSACKPYGNAPSRNLKRDVALCRIREPPFIRPIQYINT